MIPMRSLILLSGAALGLLACTSEETPTEPSASASPKLAAVRAYTVVDLGTLGGSDAVAVDINPAGEVVGFSATGAPREEEQDEEQHAFLWSKGVMTDLGTLSGFGSSAARGINPARQVVGESDSKTGTHAFLWEKGVMTDLGTLGGDYSSAQDINPAGEVVGYSQVAETGNFHAFLWSNGVMTDLGGPDGGESFAGAINPAGQVVGYTLGGVAGPYPHAFLWEKGVLTELPTPGPYSIASDINPAGEIVGSPSALWKKGERIDLGTLGGGFFVQATGINPAGQVVGAGYTSVASGRGKQAFLWTKGVMIDLGLVVGQGESTALAINPSGQVVGYTVEAEDVGAPRHATLWTR
jgi:probable HAF family extracellular repeat protein